jgi:hypothetical protein
VSTPPPNDAHRNWWTTLPGILTSGGGFIATLTGLLVALNQAGVLPVKTAAAPATGPAGEQTYYIAWHMKTAPGGSWQLDDAESLPVDPCNAGDGSSPVPRTTNAMVKAVRDYYAAWNDRRFDDAWALLSVPYQQKKKGTWRAEHSGDKAIRLSSDCVLADSVVGMTVVSTPR